MSIIPPVLSRSLQFYLSGPMPCPYLPAQVERKLFTRLNDSDATTGTEINAALCRSGFRRSHDVVYRPACTDCNACIPVRIPAQLFTPSRSLRRVAAHNRDLIWQKADTIPTTELFTLFIIYQKSRHGDSDMALMTESEFADMLQEGYAGTYLYLLRDPTGMLKGCMIADPVGDGLSAVYSFYHPDEPHRSLGSFMILSLVAQVQQNNLPFVYLGYWIAASRKMAYKSRFQPLQYLGPHGWDWLEPQKIQE